MSKAVKEAIYLSSLLISIGRCWDSIRIFNDNQSAQKLATTFAYNPRTKHIDVRHHYIQSNKCI